MALENGFTLRWRKRRAQNSVLRSLRAVDREVWETCIDLANWQDKKWFDGLRWVEIKRGTFVCTLKSLAAECMPDGKSRPVSVQNVRTAFKRLTAANLIEISTGPNKGYTIVSICNYSRYQDRDAKANMQPNSEPTQTQHSLNTDPTLTEPLQPLQPLEQLSFGAFAPETSPPATRKPRSKNKPIEECTETHQLRMRFCALYEGRTGSRPLWQAKHSALAKKVLQLGLRESTRRLDLFFEYAWPPQKTFESFAANINAFVAAEAPLGRPAVRDKAAELWAEAEALEALEKGEVR